MTVRRSRFAWTTTVDAAIFNVTGWNDYSSTTGGVAKTGTVYGAGSAISSTAPNNKTYAWDPNGKILYQGSPTAQAGGGVEPGGYTYPAQGATSVLPHAVTATVQGAYVYNANGSVI